jgi:hypothetical protein
MPYYIALTSYISFGLLFVFGHLRDAWRALVPQRSRGGGAAPAGYAPLCKDWEDFYTRRMYYRLSDAFNRPIAGAPDAWIDVVDRVPSAGSLLGKTTATTRRCLNLGSYNYLGFAADDPYCTQRVRPRRPGHLLLFQAPSCATRHGTGAGATPRGVSTRLGTELAGTLGAKRAAGVTTPWRRSKGRPSLCCRLVHVPVLSLVCYAPALPTPSCPLTPVLACTPCPGAGHAAGVWTQHVQARRGVVVRHHCSLWPAPTPA